MKIILRLWNWLAHRHRWQAVASGILPVTYFYGGEVQRRAWEPVTIEQCRCGCKRAVGVGQFGKWETVRLDEFEYVSGDIPARVT